MKVRFIKNHPAYAHFPGQEVELADAAALLEGGYVEPVKEQTETATLKVSGRDLETAIKPAPKKRTK